MYPSVRPSVRQARPTPSQPPLRFEPSRPVRPISSRPFPSRPVRPSIPPVCLVSFRPLRPVRSIPPVTSRHVLARPVPSHPVCLVPSGSFFPFRPVRSFLSVPSHHILSPFNPFVRPVPFAPVPSRVVPSRPSLFVSSIPVTSRLVT